MSAVQGGGLGATAGMWPDCAHDARRRVSAEVPNLQWDRTRGHPDATWVTDPEPLLPASGKMPGFPA